MISRQVHLIRVAIALVLLGMIFLPIKWFLGQLWKLEAVSFLTDLVVLPGVGIDVILGMNWMSGNRVLINTTTRVVMWRDPSTREAFLERLPRDIHIRSTVNAVTAKAI